MIFWPKLLSIAHAITSSVQPFLPLFFFQFYHFSFAQIGTLIALLYLVRVPASGFWSIVVEKRPALHGVFTGLLTAIGTGAVVLLLSVPPDTFLTWPAAVLCITLDGWFYQPLGVLVDSAIIKILGDYKNLYDQQRRWGKWMSAIMAVGIGWFLDDDHDFDTLLGTTLMGSVLLFLLSLSTNAQPADPFLLGVSSVVPDDTTPLIKGAKSPWYPTSPTSPSPLAEPVSLMYKPYSMFGGHLSHISEDDEEENITAMPTSHSKQTLSLASDTASLCTTTTDDAPPFYVSDYHCIVGYNGNPDVSATEYNILGAHDACGGDMACAAFALLPLPPPDSPLVALILCTVNNRDERRNGEEVGEVVPMLYRSTLLASVTLLGCTCALMNTLLYIYLHDILGVPMHLVGVVGMTAVVSDLLANLTFYWLTERASTRIVCAGTHVVLMLCSLCYTWLTPNHALIHAAVILLQALQSYGFSLLWLTAARQVTVDFVTDPAKRMMFRAKMSALYTGLGPVIGAFLAGQFAGIGIIGFQWIYFSAMATVALSSVVSWGWMIYI